MTRKEQKKAYSCSCLWTNSFGILFILISPIESHRKKTIQRHDLFFLLDHKKKKKIVYKFFIQLLNTQKFSSKMHKPIYNINQQ